MCQLASTRFIGTNRRCFVPEKKFLVSAVPDILKINKKLCVSYILTW